MSTLCGKLCSSILKELFGESVQKVGNVLFTCGQVPLKVICSNKSLTLKSTRLALCVLMQYGLVSYTTAKNGVTLEYRLIYHKVLKLLRYPHYLFMIKKLYGKESEVMIEQLLKLGRLNVSQILFCAYARLTEDQDLQEVDKALAQRLRDQLEVLINKQYVGKLAENDVEMDVSVKFAPPRVELAALISAIASGQPDMSDRVMWTVNLQRLHQDIRDDVLVAAISRRINAAAGDVLRLVLRQAYLVSPVNAVRSNPVMLTQLKDHARKSKMDVKHLEEYLAIIGEDASNFLSRDEVSPSPAYLVNMQQAIEELTWTILATAVETRYGTAASRIFRLVRKEEYIEQDEIQKKAMWPDKECKLLTYTLVQGGWLQQQELRKSLQKGGPTKNFYLFCIDLNQVVRMFIEICYKSMNNSLARREHVVASHAALLDKQQRFNAIIHHMQLKGADQQDIDEVLELITPPEAALLEKIHSTLNKLQQAELEIDSTLFILEMCLEIKQ